jgi:cellobiose transport system permease protein
MPANRSPVLQSVVYVAVSVGGLLSMFPFYWLIVMTTRTTSDIFRFPPKVTFGTQLFHNIDNVMQNADMSGAFANTIFVSVVSTLLTLFFCALAGFCFAKFIFPGRNILFIFLLATMMIPSQLSLVPSFIIIQKLGWIGSFKALIIPGMANAFGIFWIRQYALDSIHDDLLLMGRIDGCNIYRLFWHIALPILRPALAFLAIFTFIGTWNDYLWPLIVLNDPAKFTLQLVLAQLKGVHSSDYAMIMAGTMLATLPLIILFIMVSKQFISDIMAGAVKD